MKWFGLVIAVLFWLPTDSSAQVCTPTTHTFVESFDNTTYKDAATTADKWGTGKLAIKTKGANFAGISASTGVAWRAMVPADWDGDGFTDIIAKTLTPACHIHFFRNKGVDAGGNHLGFDPGGVSGSAGFNAWYVATPAGTDACEVGSRILQAGDFDGDGDVDVLFQANHWTSGTPYGEIYTSEIYEFTGWDVGLNKPNFVVHNVFPSFSADPPHHFKPDLSYTTAGVIDWDKDGKDDFITGNTNGNTNEIRFYRSISGGGTWAFEAPVILISNVGFSSTFGTTTQLPGTQCEPAAGRSNGVTGFAIADFDGDGDRDFIIGSVNETILKFWKNDGSDSNFIAGANVAFAASGTNIELPGDFDRDGDIDLIIGRDGFMCGGAGNSEWFLKNNGTGTFTASLLWPGYASGDLDYGIVIDLNNDGDYDFIVSDGNDAGSYYATVVTPTSVYSLLGTGVSKSIDGLANATNAVTTVTLSNLSVVKPVGTDILYYVSNDNGMSWEQLSASELPPTSNPHTFSSFGADLRWKAELTTPSQAMLPADASLAPGSYITPEIDELGFSFTSVDRRRFSRSGVSVAKFTWAGTEYEFLIGASFYYPGFEGSLRFLDIKSLTAGTVDNATGLERVDTHVNVTLAADAADVLVATAGNTRVFYGAYADAGLGPTNDRVSMTTGEMNTPTTNPTLQTMTGLTAANKVTVLDFLRNGMNHATGNKFYDPGHSTPIFVGVPSADNTYMGTGYDTFKTAQSGREPVVYIGANDGFLHAFNPITRAEKWAFSPYNLLLKLKNQYALDAAGNAHYAHDFYVDGDIVAQDIKIGANWKTVLVAGQAKGKGRGDANYYFALDVTSPNNPLPLWEYSDPYVPATSCTGDPCETICVPDCPPPVCTPTCDQAGHVFQVAPADEIWIEAEHYNSKSTLSSTYNWAVEADASSSGGSLIHVVPDNVGGACAANSTVCGAVVRYDVNIQVAGTYYLSFREKNSNSNDDNDVQWAVDGAFVGGNFATTRSNPLVWSTPATGVALTPGVYSLQVYMRDSGLYIDKFRLKRASSVSPAAGAGSAESCQVCTTPPCNPPICNDQCKVGAGACAANCAAGQDWPECGAGKECCGSPGSATCQTTGTCGTATPDTAMGETWSTPIFGRVSIGGTETWVVFFGSGYDNISAGVVGRKLYMLDATDGTLRGSWAVDDIVASGTNPSTIDNTLPGGPAVVDVDNNGLVDAVYFGDLEGRIWRLNTSTSGTLSSGVVSNWSLVNIFDAGLPSGAGDRIWAPIVTTPAVAILNSKAHIYFGTGGDDRAPTSPASGKFYRFYGIEDDTTVSSTRYDNNLDSSKLEWKVDGPVEHKFWSDPKISNNSVIYFASLPGTIESSNPCENIGSGSLVYGYAIRNHRDASGALKTAGSQMFTPISSTSKIRQSVFLRTGFGYGGGVATPVTPTAVSKTDVFIQEFTGNGGVADAPAVRRLTDGGVSLSTSKRLQIQYWREVPLP